MFGFVQASPASLSEEEKARYREVYCGLCHALKERYGQVSRFCLTYDLTFYVLLCNSLDEPPERRGSSFCVAHPGRRLPHAASRFTDYAADLSVALAYHKMADDWNDERKLSARTAKAALSGAYARARQRIPKECAAIEESLSRIVLIERDPAAWPDDAAIEFGRLLGELFARGQGVWAESMRAFGDHLGRFVYFMDAAVDIAEDLESGSYNPFRDMDKSPDGMRMLLAALMDNAAAEFEKLPLVQDLHLMRSVLYEGVWQKFNKEYAEGGAVG